MNGGHYCLVSVVLLLWINSWARLSVSATAIDVRRIPGEPVQLQSGDSVVLICTVTTDTVTAIQWFNGTTPLQGNSDGVIITLPYRLNNATWQSAMEVVVLTVHSTGLYYCNPDELGFGSVRVNVLDAVDDYAVLLSTIDASIYATVPFTIQCMSTLPKDNHLQIEVSWFRDDAVVSPLDSVVHTEYINSTTLDSQLTITEQLPAPEVQYKCALKAFTADTVIYTIEKSTPIQEIKVAPSLDLMVESIPAGGPVLDSSYILTCIAGTPSINGSVSLRWKYPDGAPVLSGGHLLVEEVISVGNGSHVSLTLSKVLGEATYICYGSMELYEYPDHTIESTLTETVVAPVQVMSVSISALPSDTLNWYEGSDAALICTIHTNRPTTDLIVEWHNSHGIIDTSNSPVASFSDNTVHQSILELKSLTVHSDVYYCKASILEAGTKQDWHYVNVESDIPSFIVSLGPSLSHIPTAGMSYSLVCSSNKPDNIVGQPTVTWSRSGAIKQALSDTVVDSPVDNGTHFISELHFVSIGYIDTGKYTCEVEYDFFGSGSTVRISDPHLLEVKVPSPTASITMDQGGLVCTVRMSSSQSLLPSVNIAWYLSSDSNTSVIASSIPGIAVSDVSVLECNELYEAVLSFSDFRTFQNDYTSVTCEVNISVEVQNTLNSLSDITVNFQNIQGKAPSKPSNVAIRDRGSHWGEISWTSFDSDVNADSFIVQYQRTSNDTAVVLSTNRVYSSSDGSTYSAIVTDLSPATQYNIQLTVHSGANTNKSEEIRFTTNDTIPTGVPLNLSRSYSQDGELILQWSPPKADQQNGVITGYSVSCDPSLNLLMSNGSATTPHTNVSLHGLVVRTVYHCSVAAVNSEGVGPVTSLQFSLSAGDTVEGVTEFRSMWGWSMISAIAAGIFGVILLIVIAFLAVSVFYYKRKFRLYFQHVCSGKVGLPSSPSDSLSRTNRADEDTPRYVPSDAIGEMFERSHRYTPVRRQSSTIPLQEELKHMESEIL